jgi:hypothetical protein
MKKIAFLLSLLLICGLALQIKAQSMNDRAMILQRCIDLPALQQYFNHNQDGTCKQLRIMQHGVSFETDLPVSKSGKALTYMTKTEIIDSKADAFFLFHTLTINQLTATVSFVYYLNYTQNQDDLVAVNLVMQKTGDSWNITETSIERR